MSAGVISPERLFEVLRLATALADRALDAQIAGRPVPADQASALAKVAGLLQDYGVEWPPLLTQALHGLVPDADAVAVEPEPAISLPNVDLDGLTRFFARFRKDASKL
ncbi:hypothetical protein FV222_24280 [Methylobacterium sp. WL103]|uniref:hypothetical protein n=1 Tax=Methylobacterium sp. WL103 TaxID=2603891 RepID=UPI0011C836EF|nr:hypothetical protein [Methylobacterium sp. WL103]TXM91536.1 hypothetical protein FV222_24280 [Methylobacterium sp. WL103]